MKGWQIIEDPIPFQGGQVSPITTAPTAPQFRSDNYPIFIGLKCPLSPQGRSIYSRGMSKQRKGRRHRTPQRRAARPPTAKQPGRPAAKGLTEKPLTGALSPAPPIPHPDLPGMPASSDQPTRSWLRSASSAARYLSGDALWGDDFTPQQIEEWFADEREAYADLGSASSCAEAYGSHGLNLQSGYRHLPGRRFAHALQDHDLGTVIETALDGPARRPAALRRPLAGGRHALRDGHLRAGRVSRSAPPHPQRHQGCPGDGAGGRPGRMGRHPGTGHLHG